MLGDKKTVPLWRQRRPHFLRLERALGSRRGENQPERMSQAEQSVVDLKAESRRMMAAKRRGNAA